MRELNQIGYNFKINILSIRINTIHKVAQRRRNENHCLIYNTIQENFSYQKICEREKEEKNKAKGSKIPVKFKTKTHKVLDGGLYSEKSKGKKNGFMFPSYHLSLAKPEKF